MSWSLSTKGKAAEAAAVVERTLAGYSCPQPEQNLKSAVGEIIATALLAYPPDVEVSVEAFGSQSSTSAPESFVNEISLKISLVR